MKLKFLTKRFKEKLVFGFSVFFIFGFSFFEKENLKKINANSDSLITEIYRAIMGREPKNEEITQNQNNSASQIISNIKSDPEFNSEISKYTNEVYRQLLGRNPDPEGFNFWSKKTTSFEMYRGISGSVEFQKNQSDFQNSLIKNINEVSNSEFSDTSFQIKKASFNSDVYEKNIEIILNITNNSDSEKIFNRSDFRLETADFKDISMIIENQNERTFKIPANKNLEISLKFKTEREKNYFIFNISDFSEKNQEYKVISKYEITDEKMEKTEHFLPTNCADFETPVLPEIKCGYMIVPENHDSQDQNSKKIKLAVIKISAENENENFPLVMAQGGPGASTLSYFSKAILSDEGNIFKKNRDIILIEQRGTKFSDPFLKCESQEDIETCRTSLSKNSNLNNFDSIQNAHDIVLSMKYFGYEKFDFYGVSYGTLLGQHIMISHPESLNKIILDAVVPMDLKFVETLPNNQDRTFRELFSACKNNESCNSKYPNLETEFFSLVDELNKNPKKLTIKVYDEEYFYNFSGYDFMAVIKTLMYDHEALEILPDLIFLVKNDDFFVIEIIVSSLFQDSDFAYGMYYSVICSEENIKSENYNLENLYSQIIDSTDKEYFPEICKTWNVEYIGEVSNQKINSDIPTLLLSGNFDPVTPPSFGESLHNDLSNSEHVIFPANGHGAIMSNSCANNILNDFLIDKTPDKTCINKSIDFYINEENNYSSGFSKNFYGLNNLKNKIPNFDNYFLGMNMHEIKKEKLKEKK